MFDPWSLFLSWASKRGLDTLYNKVVGWFRKPTPRGVLIIGPGGVGKSTLAHFLAGSADSVRNETGQYVESISTETFRLSDDPAVQVIVPPGQPHRQEATWDDVLSEVSKGTFRGVMLIVAYGNHTLGDISYKNHRLYDQSKGLDDFVKKYVNECLVIEERVLKTVCSAISSCNQPIWLMTLVTKQDLWWDERDEVERHYSTRKYNRIMEQCLGRKGKGEFRHERTFVSLVVRNLMTGRDELLKKTVSGYDAPLQEKSFERLLQIFDGLMEWENQHGQ